MVISILVTIFVIVVIALIIRVLLADTINQCDKEKNSLEYEVGTYDRKLYINYNIITDKHKSNTYDNEDALLLLKALKNQSEIDRDRLIQQVNYFDAIHGTYKFNKRQKKLLIKRIEYIHTELLIKLDRFREGLM